MLNKTLERLGYNEWFEKTSIDSIQGDFSAARVVQVNKGNYKVNDGMHEMFAELSGKLKFSAQNSIDFPTVGDWVAIQVLDDYSLAIVHQVLPRNSLLKRKEPGKAVEFQLIASNIDYGLIVETADCMLNLNRLERYLAWYDQYVKGVERLVP